MRSNKIVPQLVKQANIEKSHFQFSKDYDYMKSADQSELDKYKERLGPTRLRKN